MTADMAFSLAAFAVWLLLVISWYLDGQGARP